MRRFDAGRLVGGLVVRRVGRSRRVVRVRATLLLYVTERPGKFLVSRLFLSSVSMPVAAVQSSEQTNLHC